MSRLIKHSCAFQSQHLLSRCIYCSRYLSCARRYSAEYFSPCAPHRSLREPLLQLRCHHLALATQLALAQKSTFLKISLLFIFSLPSLILPTDEREKTERTTAQLPANKKCCLLIFAIAIGCLVLADFPASSLPVTLVHPELPFPFLLAVLLCGVPDNVCGVLGCTLCFRPREFPPSTKKIASKAIFLAFLQKLLYLCTRKLNAGV